MPGEPPGGESPDRSEIALRWFTTVRWTTLLAGGGAVLAGRNALAAPAPIGPAIAALAVFAVSNIWLTWRARSARTGDLHAIAPWLMCADVGLLSWLLLRAGGVLNPASVFYLVEIVVAALVFGRRWTWIVASVAVAGYATLFLAPTDDLRAAQTMHPEIALHMQGMWLAFAATAIIIAALVTQLLNTIERRDRALNLLRARNEGAMRTASLATLAAGAAHELSTPLGTIAVAARELERVLTDAPGAADALRDARLIRDEAARCRAILDDLAGRSGQPRGEPPAESTTGTVLREVVQRLAPRDRERVRLEGELDLGVLWPLRPAIRAFSNVIQNALEAQPADEPVSVAVVRRDSVAVVRVIDHGPGLTAEQAARAGEPFFTTKPAGTGLGLFVTRSTVEQIGGTMALNNLPAGGAEVTIEIPVRVTGQQA